MTREEAIKELYSFLGYAMLSTCPQETITALQMAIKALEQKTKHGKWERHYSRPNVYADLFWHCSECGYKNNNDYANLHHKYCPICGAKMEVEEKYDE